MLLKMKKEEKQQPKEKWQWLLEPQSVLVHPPGELFKDSIVFIVLALATYLVSVYLPAVNFVFFFIRWGSLVLLVLTIATIICALKLVAHLIHGIVRLKSAYKLLIFFIIAVLAIMVIAYKDILIPPLIRWLWRLPLGNLNPFSFYWWNPYYW
jgi:hypothetical protein